MTIREIITLPDPRLRRKAHKVTNFDQDLQVLIEDMVETMRNEPGVGLAAPQVAVSSRLVVVEWGKEEGDEDDESMKDAPPKKLYVAVNPEIVSVSEEMLVGVEGCLSVPGVVGEVERHASIVVKALNRQGKPIKIKASGWLARIFQHEMDHLNGIVFVDRAEKVWQPQQEEETDSEEEERNV